MSFTTVVKPHLAERWRKAGEWRNETFFDILARQAEQHPDREVFVDGQDRITYRRAQGQGRALRRLPAPHRHQARRRRHHPAAEPHRLSRSSSSRSS